MSARQLELLARPALSGPRMVLGLSGWMDGGDVSTGTIRYLAEKLSARPFARIAPEDFYVYSFPGSSSDDSKHV